MRHETHYIKVTPARWKELHEGVRQDVLPADYGFVEGDHILYQPYGDKYNERLMRKKILKVEQAVNPYSDNVIITLDRSDKQKILRDMLFQVSIAIVVLIILLILGYTI
jgi:hypothetical protein